MHIEDLEVGRAGEYLVCADLILKGYKAFLTDQGIPYDVVLEANSKLYKIQVKTTRQPVIVPQRIDSTIRRYSFQIRKCGKGGRRSYQEGEIDIFALVALDTRTIGYLWDKDTMQTMFFSPEDQDTIYTLKGTPTKSSKKLSECIIEL